MAEVLEDLLVQTELELRIRKCAIHQQEWMVELARIQRVLRILQLVGVQKQLKKHIYAVNLKLNN